LTVNACAFILQRGMDVKKNFQTTDQFSLANPISDSLPDNMDIF
jgi:hypothetical protein